MNHQVNRSFFLGAALLLAGCSSLWKPFAQSNPASCVDPTDPPCGAGLVCDLIRNKCMTASLGTDGGSQDLATSPDLRACTKPVKFLPSMTFQGGVQTVWLGAADMNGDAKLDIVHLSLSDPTNDMEYLPGDGSGGFGARRVIYGGANSGPSALADFNKDGKPDLVVPAVGFRNARTIMSLGASWTMAGSGIILGSSDRTCCAVAAKFRGNSFPFDVAIGNSTTDPSISLGDGSGGFTILAQRPSVPMGAFAIAAADFDGDLLPDLAVAPNDLVSSKAQIRLFRGVGDGTFTSWPDLAVGSIPSALATAYLDGDKKADLIIANQNSNIVSVALGTDQGGLGPARHYPVEPSPVAVTTGDFNGDMIQDLAVVSLGSSRPSVSVLLADGIGGYCPAVVLQLAGMNATVESLVAADFNGDSYSDLAVNQNSSDIVLFLADPKAM